MSDLDEAAIYEIAAGSDIASYAWRDRGPAPIGFTKGIALAFAMVLQKLGRRDSAAQEMAKANTHRADVDALSHYKGIFDDLGMDNSRKGVVTLRHLFTLQFGHAMRESSGIHCVGRDMSAENVTADTAEAGLFSMSWNARSCSPEMQKLFDHYSAKGVECTPGVFAEGVSCNATDWQCYGSGAGFEYQRLSKRCPQFAIETAAIALRNLYKHFGPIVRYEAEVRPEADAMFLGIQGIVIPSV